MHSFFNVAKKLSAQALSPGIKTFKIGENPNFFLDKFRREN